MKNLLWGLLGLCVLVLGVLAVISVIQDMTRPDRSLNAAKPGDCVGFQQHKGQGPEDPGGAIIVGCDEPTARYRILADSKDSSILDPQAYCRMFEDTVKILTIGPSAPSFGRALCLDRLDHR